VNYVDTGRRLCEKIELEESGMTPEDCTWRLLAIKSPDDNLCDGQADGTCQGDDYFTDDQWGIVVWCKVHLDQIIATGDFIELH
jgi:hypothetical protein